MFDTPDAPQLSFARFGTLTPARGFTPNMNETSRKKIIQVIKNV